MNKIHDNAKTLGSKLFTAPLISGNLEKHRFFIEVIKMLIKPTGIGWKIV